MSDIFNIKTKSKLSRARTGILNLFHGKVRTPNFMPIATTGAVKTVSFNDLKILDADIILTNTYHLWLRPGMNFFDNLNNQHKNIHNFMSWNKPILSDSGGFQAFSLSKIRKFSDLGVTFKSHLDGKNRFLTPEISMQIQASIGTDIGLVLDECLEAQVDYNKAKCAMIRTFEWAKRSIKEFNRIKKFGLNRKNILDFENYYSQINQLELKNKKHFDPKLLSKIEILKSNLEKLTIQNNNPINNYPRYLFGIPQGAQFLDLRKESAKLTMELNFDGYSIGGVANGGEPEEMMYAQVYCQTEILEEDKPKHLLGVGRPVDIIEMVKAGIDLFDCVYPTRRARHGMLFSWINKSSLNYTTHKITNLKYSKDFSKINPDSKFEELKTCSKAYLWHLFKTNEILALRLSSLNNLEFYLDLMKILQIKIENGEI